MNYDFPFLRHLSQSLLSSFPNSSKAKTTKYIGTCHLANMHYAPLQAFSFVDAERRCFSPNN